MDHYLHYNMELFKQDKYGFPVVRIDDIKLYCVHYQSFDDFKESWERRVKRINMKKIFVIMTQRDGCTIDDIKDFEKLNYKHKVIFVNKPMPSFKSTYYIKETKKYNSDDSIVDLSNYISFFSGKRFIDYYDWVSFLNENNN